MKNEKYDNAINRIVSSKPLFWAAMVITIISILLIGLCTSDYYCIEPIKRCGIRKSRYLFIGAAGVVFAIICSFILVAKSAIFNNHKYSKLLTWAFILILLISVLLIFLCISDYFCIEPIKRVYDRALRDLFLCAIGGVFTILGNAFLIIRAVILNKNK